MMRNRQHESDITLEAQFIRSDNDFNPVSEFGFTVLDQSSLKIAGNVKNIELALYPPLTLDKFTLMKLGIVRPNDVSELRVCLIESESETAPLTACVPLGYTETEVSVGEMFARKGAAAQGISISKIQFSQVATNAKASILSQISFRSAPESDLFDEDGNCIYPNAVTIEAFETCECIPGFVSSEGGISLSENAACVSCLVSEYCHFEGHNCESNSDCYSRICNDGVCKQNVSTKYTAWQFSIEIKSLNVYLM